ncbi:hypothetical protein KCP74_01915 [Salmonella enterica subsp. enterica]|nr:hypothetical protein KCP74_01915 [Salmonella enterica subsp. enterica]
MIESTSVVFRFQGTINGKDIAMPPRIRKWLGHRAERFASGNLSPELSNPVAGTAPEEVATLQHEPPRAKRAAHPFANKQVIIRGERIWKLAPPICAV